MQTGATNSAALLLVIFFQSSRPLLLSLRIPPPPPPTLQNSGYPPGLLQQVERTRVHGQQRREAERAGECQPSTARSLADTTLAPKGASHGHTAALQTRPAAPHSSLSWQAGVNHDVRAHSVTRGKWFREIWENGRKGLNGRGQLAPTVLQEPCQFPLRFSEQCF